MIAQTRSKALAAGVALVLLAGIPVAPAFADGFRLWAEPIDLWVLERDQDTDSSKFQEYRDLSSGLWAAAKLFGETEDAERSFAIRLKGIGRDDAHYTLDYRREAKYSFSIDYNQIPHRFGNDAFMPWDRPALNRLEFPDPVQGVTSEEIFAFINSADRIDLGLRRDRTRARLDLGKLGRFAWAVEYTQENRNGDRPLGVAFGFGNVQEIPEPIDYTTQGAAISGEFNGENSGVRFGYHYSTFENELGDVVWDNPFNSVEADRNPSRGRFDLAPDNEAGLFFLDGRAKGERWWFNGNLNYNTLTQDDALLPYTINSAIPGIDGAGNTFPADSAARLPVRNADNEATILNYSVNAGTDLAEDWHLTFRYRYYDYDNDSPRIVFPGYVRLDERWEEDALITVPYSYSRDETALRIDWDVSSTTSLGLEYSIENWDRDFREVRETEEDVLELSVNSRPSDKVSLRASWATGERTISNYLTEAQLVFFVEPHSIDNLPGLRKYDQAVRDVDDYDLLVQVFPSDNWNVSFGFSGYEEDYPESEFGLVTDEVGNFNFEIAYTPGAHLNFYLFGHNEDRDVFQRARQSGRELSTNPQDNWSVDLNEDTLTWGAGLSGENDDGWSWDLSVNVSDTDGEADFDTPPGGSPAEVVDIANYEDIELLAVRLKVEYELNERVSCGAFYLYEDYTIDSFILQGLLPFIASTQLLVPNDGDYEGQLLGVGVRLRF